MLDRRYKVFLASHPEDGILVGEGDEQTSGPPLLPVGVPRGGLYTERLNTDSQAYGGSNVGNAGAVMAAAIPCHGRPFSLDLTLPPLATLVLVPQSGI